MAASDLGITVFLIYYGADVNVQDYQGKTPLLMSLGLRRLEIANEYNDGITLLMMNAKDNYVESAKVLLEHGASIDIRDNNGNTAYGYANDDIKRLIFAERSQRNKFR